MLTLRLRVSLLVFSAACLVGLVSCTAHKESAPQVPASIQAIFDKPAYQGAVWGLRAVDLDSGRTLIDVRPDYHFLIGSVRKVFSVGELLSQIGPDHRYDTPVYRRGSIDGSGVLKGDLILVASGDLTMGGRTNPDGSIAVSNWDHNEADALGNAVLTAPDPLAGYKELSRQIAGSGIKEIKGEIVIDDRLFQPFNFREQFDVRPIFVNDDVVDVSIHPAAQGKPAMMTHRPESAALAVKNKLTMGGSEMKVEMEPDRPSCIGQLGCTATVAGNLPMEFVPPFTGKYPLVRTFRIVQPSNYARTVLIETLKAAGVKVDAPVVEANPARLLPAKNSYSASDQVAKLTGMTYMNDARLILKISYNIGADTSLVLYGLTQNVDNIKDALAAERKNLSANYGIADTEYSFVDGSGGGDSSATTDAVIKMLADIYKRPVYAQFSDALPSLGVDGSLSSVTGFESDATLAGAMGQVHAKTGTYLLGSASGLVLKGQALGGYVMTKSGKHIAFQLAVNNVPVTGLTDVLKVFQDQGTISAVLWREF